MKNIITTLVITVISLSVFGQTALAPALPASVKQIDRAQVEALKANRMQASNGSRAVQTLVLDYDAVDEFETTTFGGAYERFIWDLNTSYNDQDTNLFALTWGVTRFDTLIGLDDLGNVVSYPRNSTDVHLDSVQVFVTHQNTQGTPDTVIISVYRYQGAAGLQVNGNEDIVNTVIYADTIITTTSLTAGPAQLGVLTIYPDTLLSAAGGNNRFLVGVHFYGDTANHTFTVLAGYGDRCGEACFAYPSVLELNSFWRMIAWAGTTDLTGINGIAYNCNGNGVVGEPEECEEFPIQNFAITAFVTIDPALTATITGGGAICPTESVTLSVSPVGGTGPYTVTWSPTDGLSNPFSPSTSASPSTTTVYTATIVDSEANPDTITKTVTVTVNAITINAGNDVTVNCGETTNLTATPGGVVTGATFAWSNGVNTLNNPAVGPGTYTIVATNSFGCSASDVVNVSILGVDQVLNFNTNLPANIGCKDESFTLTNTSRRLTGWNWVWTFGDNSGNISTAQDPTYVYSATGPYDITLNADSAGCTVGSVTKSVTIQNCTTGIEESWLETAVEVYPNPTTGMVTLNFKDINNKAGLVQIFDVTGKLAMQEPVSVTGDAQKSMNLSNLADGVYFVKITLGDGVAMRKLNVRR